MNKKTKSFVSLLTASLVVTPAFVLSGCEQNDGLGEFESEYTLSNRMMMMSGEVNPNIPSPDDETEEDTVQLLDPIKVGEFERTVILELKETEPGMSDPDPDNNIPDNDDYENYTVSVKAYFTVYKGKIMPDDEEYKYEVYIDHYFVSGTYPAPFTLTGITTTDGDAFTFTGRDRWDNVYIYSDENGSF